MKCRLGDPEFTQSSGGDFSVRETSEKTWEIIWVLNFCDVWHPSLSMFDREVGQWVWNPLVFEDKNNKEHLETNTLHHASGSTNCSDFIVTSYINLR